MSASDLGVARAVLKTEADALMGMADGLDERFSGALDLVHTAEGRVICAGIGKSGHVARKIAATLASTGTPAYFVHPTEASHGDLGMISRSDVVLALSRSGETAELDDLIQYTRRFSIPLIAMTAEAESALGRASDALLLVPPAPEACAETKAPTTSTTLMMALGDALAIALLERRGFKADDFKIYHPGGRLGAMLKTAGDLMTRGEALPLVAEGASLSAGLDEMSAKGLGCVGVVDAAGELAGMITDGDIRRLIADGRQADTVDEVMTRDPVTVGPGTLAAQVLHGLNQGAKTQLFVLEAGKPVGVIHLHDLLRAGVA